MNAPNLSAPVELVTSEAVAPSGGSEWPMIVALIGAIVFSLITLHLWLRTRGDGDAEEAAFRELAARLRLSREQKRLVRELAEAHPNATPTALLLSPNAIIEGAGRLGGIGGDRQRELQQLLTLLGAAPQAEAAPTGERDRLELIA